jgi:hypothetical protein
MKTSYIVEHLKAAKSLAEADRKMFLAYLIGMAIDASRSAERRSHADERSAA